MRDSKTRKKIDTLFFFGAGASYASTDRKVPLDKNFNQKIFKHCEKIKKIGKMMYFRN